MDKSYTIKELKDIGEKVINWCVDKFGLSKHYNDYPYVEIDMVETDNPLGEFISDNNEIIVYPNAIDNINDFISTVIHEYTHYMQSPSWYIRYQNNLTIDEVIKKYGNKFGVVPRRMIQYFDERILKFTNLNTVDLDHNELEFLQLKGLLNEKLIKPLYLG